MMNTSKKNGILAKKILGVKRCLKTHLLFVLRKEWKWSVAAHTLKCYFHTGFGNLILIILTLIDHILTFNVIVKGNNSFQSKKNSVTYYFIENNCFNPNNACGEDNNRNLILVFLIFFNL